MSCSKHITPHFKNDTFMRIQETMQKCMIQCSFFQKEAFGKHKIILYLKYKENTSPNIN